jgi:hypothetical protein
MSNELANPPIEHVTENSTSALESPFKSTGKLLDKQDAVEEIELNVVS